jgi:hypothetical protein
VYLVLDEPNYDCYISDGISDKESFSVDNILKVKIIKIYIKTLLIKVSHVYILM